MKTALIAAFVLFSAASASLADDILPKRPEFARYEPMLKRSPFAVATAVAAPAGAPDFARDLFVANAAHSTDGDMVTIASSTDRNFKKYPTTKTPDDGYAITNIEWSDRVGGTKVTITKDGQYATLAFNQALLLQPMNPGAPVQAQVQLPVQPPTNPLAPAAAPPAYFKPAPIPSLPPQSLPQAQVPAQNALQNRIRSRGLIQRNPTTAMPTPLAIPSPIPTPVQTGDDDE